MEFCSVSQLNEESFLSGEDLSHLLPLVPAILTFLRDEHPLHAANQLVLAANPFPTNNLSGLTHFALSELFLTWKAFASSADVTQPKAQQSPITTKALKEIYFSHDPIVWAKAVLLIITAQKSSAAGSTEQQEEESIKVSSHVKERITFHRERFKEELFILAAKNVNTKMNYSSLRKLVDFLDLDNYYALSEIVCLIGETSSDLEKVCLELGPILLLPDNISKLMKSEKFLRILSETPKPEDITEANINGVDSEVLVNPNEKNQDTSTGKKVLSQEMGQNEVYNVASKALYELVKRREALFVNAHLDDSDVLPGPTDNDGVNFRLSKNTFLGLRDSHSKTNLRELQSLHSQNLSLNRLKQHLRLFYQLREPKLCETVDVIFSLHPFSEIAKGVLMKYSALPAGWKPHVEALINKPASKELKSLKKYFDRILWLDERVLEFPAIDYEKHYNFTAMSNKLNEEERRTKSHELDQVINELISSEYNLYTLMTAFKTNFVDEVLSIAQGVLGKEAQNALGLTTEQVEPLFGDNFSKLLSVISTALVRLECLTLVKLPPSNASPATKTLPRVSRLGILCDVMYSLCPKFYDGYCGYYVEYKQTENTFKQQNLLAQQSIEPANIKKAKSKVFSTFSVYSPTERKSRNVNNNISSDTSTNKPKVNYHFNEIWKQVTKGNAKLNKRSLEAVLIKPIQRFPQYKTFFERIIKLAKQCAQYDADDIDKVQKVYARIVQLNGEIDASISSYKATKAAKLLEL